MIWDYGSGYEVYREASFLEFYRPDYFCFEDMTADENCLDKGNILMDVKMDASGRINYDIGLKTYVEEKSGRMWVREWR